MVAEFRRAIPNVHYVNLNASNDSVSSSSSDLKSNSYRPAVRGSIIRPGDSTLATGLMEAMSNIGDLLGIPSLEDSSASYGLAGNQGFPGMAQEESYNVAGHSSAYSTHAGGGLHHTSAMDFSPQQSPSHMSPLSSSPQIRIADFSRTSSFNGFTPHSNHSTMPRSHTVADPNTMSSAMRSMNDGSQPSYTVIRSTSTTYEFSVPNPLQPAMDSGSSFTAGLSQGLAFGEGGVIRQGARRTCRSARPNQLSNSSCINPQCSRVKDDMLKGHESLARENANLKRKLKVLASTIADQEKLKKVLKCLEDQKHATGATSCR